MNKEKLIAAFEAAKAQNIKLGKKYYLENGAYCSIGWLAHEADVSDETLILARDGSIGDSETIIIYEVTEAYGMDDNETPLHFYSDLLETNDAAFETWDDAIEFVKGYSDASSD